MSNKTTMLRVRLTEEQLEKLIKHSEQQGLTRSKLIVQFIESLSD
jgi:hypothetical protein